MVKLTSRVSPNKRPAVHDVVFRVCRCLEVSNFIKRKTLAQVFSREFCEIFKKNFFKKHLQATASECFPVNLLKFLRVPLVTACCDNPHVSVRPL